MLWVPLAIEIVGRIRLESQVLEEMAGSGPKHVGMPGRFWDIGSEIRAITSPGSPNASRTTTDYKAPLLLNQGIISRILLMVFKFLAVIVTPEKALPIFSTNLERPMPSGAYR